MIFTTCPSQYFLFSRTDIDEYINVISRKEPLITEKRVQQLRDLILKLKEKLGQTEDKQYAPYKVKSLIH